MSEPNGWNREYPLIAKDFVGTSFTAETMIDLKQIKRYLGWVQTQTGLERRSFDIEIIVDTQVEGTIDGHPFNESFPGILRFKLDEIQLYLSETSPLAEDTDPLKPARTGFIPHQSIIDNTLPILGFDLTVRQARQIALIVGGSSFLLIALIMTPAMAVSLRSESERIKLLHTDRLLDVDEIPVDKGLKWVQVASIDDLIKLSESTGGLILHTRSGHDHTYVLQDGTTGYKLEIHDPNGTDEIDATQDSSGGD